MMSDAGGLSMIRAIPVLLLFALTALPASAEEQRIILDETAYCRAYHQLGLDRISGDALRNDREKYLSKKRLKEIQRGVKETLGNMGRSKDFKNWMDHAWVSHTRIQATNRNRADSQGHLGMVPPPEDWFAASFDDSAWLRQRQPLMVGRNGSTYGTRAAYLRYPFHVPDPAQAGELVLNLTYRGGLRVLLNGKEVARGHLPKGDLPEEAFGDGYPVAAYLKLDAEGRAMEKKVKGNVVKVALPPVSGSFDNAPDAKDRKRKVIPGMKRANDGTPVSREDWEKAQKLRDRRLGPIRIPSATLRKGVNVLAFEVRACQRRPLSGRWTHGHLLSFQLKGSLKSHMTRPAGQQVWVEDIHRRLYASEFLSPGANPGTIRIVGAQGGAYGAQIVVGTDKPLKNLRVQVGDLLREGEGELVGSIVTPILLKGRPASELVHLGQFRGGGGESADPRSAFAAKLAFKQHGPGGGISRDALKAMIYFDELDPEHSRDVPADSCQPVWLRFNIPVNAQAGKYTGTATITADGMDAFTLPVEAEVFAWRISDARDLQTIAAIEQSPYGVAKATQVELWSDRHFSLMEASFKHLARAGCDWVFVPLINDTEFGNKKDTPIQWTRKKDGSLHFDFSRMGRYLDMAVKHLGIPRVICLQILHGSQKTRPEVLVFDEKSGKKETLSLANNAPHYRKVWTQFVLALTAYMRERGLTDTLYWGYAWDGEGDGLLRPMVDEVAPEIRRWAQGGHGKGNQGAYQARSIIYWRNISQWSQKGWKPKNYIELYNPRGLGSVIGVFGYSLPFAYRLLPDRSLVVGTAGFARMGADYWNHIYMEGSRSTWCRPGMPIHSVFYPGKNGANSSARYEALIEGIQETEARIFLEQAVVNKRLDENLTKEVNKVLFDHNRQTLFQPSQGQSPHKFQITNGWQARSKRLWDAAAKAAKQSPLDTEGRSYDLKIEALGLKKLSIPIRNWTHQTRAIKASADQKWIQLAQSSMDVSGHMPLHVKIDASLLKPEEKASGKITITDVQSGKTFIVPISVSVGAVFKITMVSFDMLGNRCHAGARGPRLNAQKTLFYNVAPGGQETQDVPVVNYSSKAIQMKATTKGKGITVNPAEWEIPAYGRKVLKVTVSCKASEPMSIRRDEMSLALASGEGSKTVYLQIQVIPPYVKPSVPAGKVVYLSALKNKSHVELHYSRVYRLGTSIKARDDYGPVFKEKDMISTARQRTRYKVEGQGYSAFAAEVKAYPLNKRAAAAYKDLKVSFEIFGDGRLLAQSGLMGPGEESRTLVVDEFETIKSLTLKSRYDRPVGKNLKVWVSTVWKKPRFIR